MALKKQSGNMYDFVTHMWSPIKGKCSHSCSYCYVTDTAKRYNKEQKPLHLDEKDLNTNLGEGNFIFVCHTCDMFAEDVKTRWIQDVLEKCNQYNKNRYLFQSKNPKRMYDWLQDIPTGSLIGTTIETNRNIVESKAPAVTERASYMYGLKTHHWETMITIEPIFDFDLYDMIKLIQVAQPDWVNIGADSKGHKLPEPTPEKIKALIEALKKETDVKLKGNLKRIYGRERRE